MLCVKYNITSKLINEIISVK